MVKFTSMVTALLVAAVGALAANLPGRQAKGATPAAHRLVEAQNSQRWTEVSIELGAQQIAVQAMVDARDAEAARQAEAASEQAARTLAARPAAPTPTPVPLAGSIQEIIVRACWPYGQATVDWCLRVAQCESGDNPNAYNRAGPYYGLFQFAMPTFKSTPYGNQNIYDPYYNAAAAGWKYSVSGGVAWGCK